MLRRVDKEEEVQRRLPHRTATMHEHMAPRVFRVRLTPAAREGISLGGLGAAAGLGGQRPSAKAS